MDNKSQWPTLDIMPLSSAFLTPMRCLISWRAAVQELVPRMRYLVDTLRDMRVSSLLSGSSMACVDILLSLC